MTIFLQNLINALQWGSFYALIAIGYSMAYSILMLFNFAHGDNFMTGSYIGFGVATGLIALSAAGVIALPNWLILVLTILFSMVLTSFLGMFIERVGYRPLRDAPRASAAITGVMIGIILETGNLRVRQLRRVKEGGSAEPDKHGTVGAVALDSAGNLAAATSTGGIVNKRPGRIGDSPLVGAGTWAENGTVAVSATGTGEMFIRSAAAHEVAALVRLRGLSPQKAADEALARVAAVGGRGGLVVLDRSGVPAFSFTTEGMFRGFARGDAAPEVMIFR